MGFPPMSDRKLTLADIADLRAYERERDAFREHVIALKKRRRISVGPHLTLVFENRDTIRFQIQEMARAERILTDEGIETELRIYNPLIPEPGHLSATLFLELTTDEELRTWLPKLVGIERSVVLRLADGTELRCQPDADHEAQLTREEVTASVHYVGWTFTPQQIDTFADGGVTLVVDHPEYRYETALSEDNIAELLTDLRPDGN
jgi:hypothetical protein